jgi:calcineurin-like phosphoesterase family protein
MNIFFTSDLHLSHRNVLLPTYDNRPFKTIEEHDQALIENWNRVVGPDDVVYFLGDLAFCKPSYAVEMVSRLSGQKRWITGNHDHERMVKKLAPLFVWVKDSATIAVPDSEAPRGAQYIYLHHFACLVWDRSHYGSWHLYGHSHGRLPDNPKSLSIDVGVDCHNYAPISYAQVKEIMSRKEWTPPDYLLARE